MNETILTNRQKSILNLISQSTGISRGNIQKLIQKIEVISKPTLIRDLNFLIKNKLIKVEGNASSTKYFSFEDNPLLKYFDLDTYFKLDPDQRLGVKKKFDYKIIGNFKNLFSKIEIEEINIKKSFLTESSKLSLDIYKKELERFVIEFSWKSSKIEGNTYSLLETEELIQKSVVAEGHAKEETVMILNHKRAFDAILKNYKDYNKLTVSKVNQIHSLLVDNLGINSGIRSEAVGITGTVYVPFDLKYQIEDALSITLELINKTKNPLEKGLIATTMIPYIQPYSDGNKRTTRMLVNAILLTGDYYPLSYRNINVEEYKKEKAMILFYEQGSIYHLKRLFLEQIFFTYKNYFR